MSEPPELVKPPQSRRGAGLSEVRLEDASRWGRATGRVFVKRQDRYTCRPAWRAWRRTPTLRRELRGLRACHALGIDVPEVVSYRQNGLQAELVLAEITDVLPFREALAEAGSDALQVLARVAAAIARLHDAGWSHGALLSDHILVRPGADGAVFLIDFEKARRSRRLAGVDIKRLLRRSTFLDDAQRQYFTTRYRAARQHGWA